MILRLQLRHWRAYEHLDLELSPGTTFIVASNGVGKTSLVMALVWAVYGDDSNVPARDCIRAGADKAWVQVDMLLPSGRELTVERTVKLTGKHKAAAWLDGEVIAPEGLEELYEAEFRVAAPIAARLSLMAGGAANASTASLNLEDHLYEAFGVKNLVTNAATARAIAKKSVRRREQVRRSSKERLKNREVLKADLGKLKDQCDLEKQRVSDLKARLAEVDRQRSAAVRAAEQDERLRRHESDLHDLVERAKRVVRDLPTGLTDTDRIVASLDRTITTITEWAEAAVAAETSARGTVSSAHHALDLLASPTAMCPTCLRPIEADEIGHAVAQHHERLQAAEQDAQRHADEAREHHERLQALQSISMELHRLSSARSTPDYPDIQTSLAVLESEHAGILAELERANRDVGAAERQIQDLETTLDEDDRLAREDEELTLAYRQEAVAEAAATALECAARQAVDMLIEPIKQEVRWTWKRLFHDDGLTFRADGSMVRVIEGRELSWESLSGGEQTWARIVAHILVLATSTSLPFAWFDEPLEHLDPKIRHSVAATLATATRFGSPPQLLVTTYEHALASQLADDLDDARLVNVRETGVASPSQPNDLSDEQHGDAS